uniref:hypothetical protein n=1 Tax=Brucella pseudintermedia TaxID=370111 RepID=UPI00158928C8|nr:hypothetical protein [Brucella pseudintermedia]
MKDDFDLRLVANMWATRRLIWLAWGALLLALSGLYEQGISFISIAVFVAAIALSIAILMAEIERAQPANDARWQKFRDQQGDRGRVD